MARSASFWLPPLALAVSSSLAAQAPPGPAGPRPVDPPFQLPGSVEMLSDLLYAEPDGQSLRLDLFLPREGEGPFPAAVFFHGGGWSGGARTQFWRQAAHLAGRGFVAATVQYRLAPRSRFPAALNDAQAAVRWLRAHATQYRVDPNRVAVVGGSAGGHLAALLGMNAWTGSDWSGAPTEARVQGVVAFNAVLDLRPAALPPSSQTVALGFLGVSFEANPALWNDASPLTHVGPDAAPFLLLHGTDDRAVPYDQSVEMQRRLRDAGVCADLFTAEGAGHAFFNAPPWYAPTLVRMEQFLVKLLK